jgi:Adenylate and Guanylate cyclase catalytic domain
MIIVSFREVLELKVAAVASLGVSFTAFGNEGNNRSWPFVTLNDFQQRCASTKTLSEALFLDLLPIVSEANREDWEAYSVDNQAWITDGLEFQDRFGLGTSRSLLSTPEAEHDTGDVDQAIDKGSPNISQQIFSFDERERRVVDPGPGPYYPRWQSSPILPRHQDLVNYNLVHYGDHGHTIEVASTTGQIAFTGVHVADEGDVDFMTSFLAQLSNFEARQLVNYTGLPMSSVYIPVFDSFDDDRSTVALLGAVLHWQTFLNNTLPANSTPVIVVLENTCDGQYSYEVSGDGAEYLGRGNQANVKYSDMVVRTGLDDDSFSFDPTTVNLTLNHDACMYYISVYPSEEMDETYNTINPLLITYAMASVFISFVGVFLIYDRMVEQRQTVVMNTAQRSTAIVTSIYPKQVVGRLMTTPIQGNATKLRSLIHHGDGMDKTSNEGIPDSGMAPIADLFPEATVMFADVQGFTAWSSIREPSQVFALLENLYNAFDQVAARRRVFKVETVGDCYVSL